MAVNAQNKGIVFSPSIAQDFDINYSLKIAEFSTEFATAYDAKPRTPQVERVDFYALIFNKFFPADLDKINIYKNLKEKNLQEMVDFGRVQTAKGEALCCIFKKPIGLKLSEVLSRTKNFEENFITNHIFGQLFTGLSMMHNQDIMHGSINLDNIYFNTQNGNVTIRESVSDFVGFSQKAAYETYERMVCHPAAKSNRDLSADFYACGVVIVSLISGQEVLSGITEDIVKKIKFENGSYEAIVGLTGTRASISVSQKTEILLRGVLHDKIKDRWQIKQISGWQKKEIAMPPPSRMHKQASSSYVFEGLDYFSPKFLAYTIQQNWSLAKKNLKINDLARWVTFTSRLPDIEKRLYSMIRSDQTEVITPDDKLTRIIYLLDEDGPIRYKDVSFHPDGIGNLLSYYLYKNDQPSIENLATAVDFGFIEGWISGQENQDLFKTSVLGWNPREIKIYIRKNELGFGIERCLYEFNPYLPCLSPILENTYSVGLPSVLTALNQGRLNGKEIDNDKHLTAYICKQTDIQDSIKVKSLQNYPYFGKAMPIRICAMFAIAQQKSGIDNLSGIASWMRQNLISVTDKLNSNNIKKKVVQDLDLAVVSGDLNKLFAIISDPKVIRKDVYGFQDAKKTYKILSFEILKLKNQANLDQLAYRTGLRVAVIGSYLISAIAILSLVFLNF